MSVALPGVAAALVIGLLIGLIAGYLGGKTDNSMIVVMDTMQAFPAVILALTLLALLGASRTSVIVVIAVAFAPNYARVTRALVLTTKQNQFVEAARSLGAGSSRIVGVHILPNVIAPLFILLAMDLPAAITLEAGLSFLGLGVPPPTPSWGVILQDGFERVRERLLADPLGGPDADGRDPRLHLPRRDAPRRGRPEARRHAEVAQAVTEPLLEVEGLEVRYHVQEGALTALSDVSFRVEPGEILGIVGESGCGKSTLSSALLRLLPPNGEITAGRMSFKGQDLLPAERRADAPAERVGARDDLPGSAHEPEPDVHRRDADDRRPEGAPGSRGEERRGAATAGDRAARAGRHPRRSGSPGRLPAPVLRRACGSGS